MNRIKEEIINDNSKSINDDNQTNRENNQIQEQNNNVNPINIYQKGGTEVQLYVENKEAILPNQESKKKKFMILFFIGIIILGCTIGICCGLLLKKNDKNQKEEKKNVDNIIRTNSGEEIVVDIKRKLNQNWIYEGSDIVTTISTTSLNNENELRRNEEKSENTQFKYLFNIYDQETASDKSIIFYAYALLLDKSKIIDGIKTYEGGIDILNLTNEKYEEIEESEENEEEIKIYSENEEDEDDNKIDIPIIKLKFYENGTIFEIQKPQNINHKLYSNLKNFIEKVIPSVSKDLYSNNENESLRRLNEEGISNNFEKKEGNTYLNEKRNHGVKLSDIEIENSKIEGDEIVEVDSEGNIKNIKSNHKSLMSSEGSLDEECEDTICPEENEREDNILIFPIREIQHSISSNLDLLNTNINETTSKTLNDLIKDTIFENVNITSIIVSNNERNRRLNENKEKRKLDLNSQSQYIRFSYPIFKTSIGGIKIAMTSELSFTPYTGELLVIIDYKIGNQIKRILNYKTNTGIGNSFNVFSEVTKKISGELYILASSVSNFI